MTDRQTANARFSHAFKLHEKAVEPLIDDSPSWMATLAAESRREVYSQTRAENQRNAVEELDEERYQARRVQLEVGLGTVS